MHHALGAAAPVQAAVSGGLDEDRVEAAGVEGGDAERHARNSADQGARTDADPAKVYAFGHDGVDELLMATLRTTDPTPVIFKRYRYSYDKAENRTGEQIDDAVSRQWALSCTVRWSLGPLAPSLVPTSGLKGSPMDPRRAGERASPATTVPACWGATRPASGC